MASVFTGNVWLAGPTLIIGGGSFAIAVTSRYALVEIDPATLNAEHTKNPSSSTLTPGEKAKFNFSTRLIDDQVNIVAGPRR